MHADNLIRCGNSLEKIQLIFYKNLKLFKQY
jgi:hypothetical protein